MTTAPLIIGIGASAGGLEAFKAFFGAMPPDSGLGFVLVQHMAPDHDSILVELLQRHTSMPVVAAVDGMVVEANRLHVIPPNSTLTVKDGALRVVRPAPPRNRRLPVDALLISLAEDQGERAVCVILSGGGSDGTLGLMAVKEHGGFALAQAEYDSEAKLGMPQSASATGLVDEILSAENMPARLVQHLEHLNDVQSRKAGDGTREDVEHYLPQICAQVLKQTGHDFSQYKIKTLTRRIQRRMQLLQVKDVPDYIKLLKAKEGECEELFRDLLINVTQFFRDTDAFEALKVKVIAELIQKAAPNGTIRVWVPGCATGEEAYSLAILFREAMLKSELRPTVQIFATDLDEEAVRVARSGRYRHAIAAEMSAELFERWFVQEGITWSAKKAIREMCVFSVHNLLKDPPFSKLDLISCRNLFIYLNPSVQTRLLGAFHYALGPDGFLFMGTSEGVGQQTKLFQAIDKKHRIFRRKDAAPSLPAYPLSEGQVVASLSRQARVHPSPSDRLEQQALLQIAPACLVVNPNDDIVRYLGQTGRFLEPSHGTASLNVFSVLRIELRAPARALIKQVREEGQRRSQPHLTIPVNGSLQQFCLTVAPIFDAEAGIGTVVVAFSDEGQSLDAGSPVLQSYESAAEQELRALRLQLNSVSSDLEAATDELKTSGEEYQSVNEELQSTNEELETAKEELQSTNEELHIVNSELVVKNEELSRANSDLRNFFESTDIASVFLDQNLRIRTFTPAATDVINIRDADEGRPISDLTGQISFGDVEAEVKKVVRTLSSIEREVTARNDMTYMMRIRPYRSIDNVIDGVVLTFVDITGRRRSGAATEALGKIVDDLDHAIYVCDAQTLRYVIVSRKGRERLGYEMDELRSLTPLDIEPGLTAAAWKQRVRPVMQGEQESVIVETQQRSKTSESAAVRLRLTSVVDPPLIVMIEVGSAAI